MLLHLLHTLITSMSTYLFTTFVHTCGICCRETVAVQCHVSMKIRAVGLCMVLPHLDHTVTEQNLWFLETFIINLKKIGSNNILNFEPHSKSLYLSCNGHILDKIFTTPCYVVRTIV